LLFKCTLENVTLEAQQRGFWRMWHGLVW